MCDLNLQAGYDSLRVDGNWRRGNTTERLTDFSGIIVAAGYSSRMGVFKPILPIGDKTVVRSAVRSLLSAGVKEVYVVVGYRGGDVRKALAGCPVTVVANPHFHSGMFSSIQIGVGCLTPACRGFFLLPADIPLVSPTTISSLVAALKGDLKVAYPRYAGRRGHPPLIASSCIPNILAATMDENMRVVLSAFEVQSVDVDVDDPTIHLDMDTPADYCELMRHLQNGQITGKRVTGSLS